MHSCSLSQRSTRPAQHVLTKHQPFPSSSRKPPMRVLPTGPGLCTDFHNQTDINSALISFPIWVQTWLLAFFFFNNFIYFLLRWVFVAMQAFLCLWRAGFCYLDFSLPWLLLLWSMGVWALGQVDFSSCGSQALEHRLSRCGAQA